MARLERGIQKISEEEILAVLEELFDAVSGCRNLSVTLVKRMMIEMLSRFSDKAGQLGGALEDIEVNDSYKHYQKIVHTTSFEELKAWWRAFVRQFTAQFFTRQKRSESDLIENTLEYIEQNLDKTIQLADVARHVGVSEPYLSSFFKKTMNENFIPYVNRQKMRRAKQLFAEGENGLSGVRYPGLRKTAPIFPRYSRRWRGSRRSSTERICRAEACRGGRKCLINCLG